MRYRNHLSVLAAVILLLAAGCVTAPPSDVPNSTSSDAANSGTDAETPTDDTGTEPGTDAGPDGGGCLVTAPELSDPIDATVLTSTSTSDRYIGAHGDQIWVVGGTGNSADNPTPDARIFKVTGETLELFWQAELKQLHDIECTADECLAVGGQSQLRVVDGVVLEPGNLEVVGSAAGTSFDSVDRASFGWVATAQTGLLVPAADGTPNTLEYLEISATSAVRNVACSDTECLASVVEASALGFTVYDGTGTTNVTPTGLAECSNDRCGIDQLSASNAAWFILGLDGSLHRSGDAETWEDVTDQLSTSDLTDIDFRGDFGVISAGSQVVWTTDGGMTFEGPLLVTPAGAKSIAVVSDTSAVYLTNDDQIFWIDFGCVID